MRKIAYSLLFILIGLFVVDRLGGKAMWWVNQHTRDVSGPKIKYIVNSLNEDVVMIGTSRCNLHYVPSILSDSLGLSVYNGGVDQSNNIYAHYIVLQHILAHHTPSMVCLELMVNDYMEEKTDPFSTVSFFAPYFGLNEHADSVFRDAGTYEHYKVSHLYRFNAKAVSNLAGLLVNRQANEDHGYLPQQRPTHFPDTLRTEPVPDAVDSLKIDYIQRFISACQLRDIKLVFVVSPKYSRIMEDPYGVLKKIARKNHVPFFDYHSKGLFIEHPELFKDDAHLWDKGARLYTSIFAHDLKRLHTGVCFP